MAHQNLKNFNNHENPARVTFLIAMEKSFNKDIQNAHYLRSLVLLNREPFPHLQNKNKRYMNGEWPCCTSMIKLLPRMYIVIHIKLSFVVRAKLYNSLLPSEWNDQWAQAKSTAQNKWCLSVFLLEVSTGHGKSEA